MGKMTWAAFPVLPKFQDMLVYGGMVSAEWQREAYAMWLATGGHVDGCLAATGPKPGRDAPLRHDDRWPAHWTIAEIRNRMMQRAKKEGLAEYRGKRWRPISKPPADTPAAPEKTATRRSARSP